MGLVFGNFTRFCHQNVASRNYALLSVIRQQMSPFDPFRGGGSPKGDNVPFFYRFFMRVCFFSWFRGHLGGHKIMERILDHLIEHWKRLAMEGWSLEEFARQADTLPPLLRLIGVWKT